MQGVRALACLVDSIIFVLDCDIQRYSEIPYAASDNTKPDESYTFVTAYISKPNKEVVEFRRTVFGNGSIYFVNNQQVLREEYKIKLAETEIVSSVPSLVFDELDMRRMTGLTDRERINFIEEQCGSSTLIRSQNKLKVQLDIAELELNKSKLTESNLLSEKRRILKDMASVKKGMQIVQEYNEQNLQLSLFRLFHNQKFMESVDGKIADEKEILEQLKGKRAENFEELKNKLEEKSNLMREKKKIEEKLRGIGDERNALQQEASTSRETISNLKRSEELVSHLKETMKKFQEKIVEAEIKIGKLESDNNAHLLDHVDEYENIKRNFDSDLVNKYIQHDIRVQKLVCRKEEANFTNTLVNGFKESLMNSEIVKNVSEQKLKKVKAVRDQKLQESQELEKEVKDLAACQESLLKLEAKIKRSGEEIKRADGRILKDLQQKFPTRVLGRLSEFWKVKGSESDKKFIEKCLGEFSNAIVVDNKVTANACIAYLKIKQLSDINEIFLPLSEIPAQQRTNVMIPMNDEAEKIESYWTCESEQLSNAMMHCLSPSVVFKTLEEAQEAVLKEEYKKVNIVSMEGPVLFKRHGTISPVSLDDSRFSAEELVEAEQQKLQLLQSLIQKKTAVDKNACELNLIRSKIVELNNEIEVLENGFQQNLRNCEFYRQELEKVLYDLESLESDEDCVRDRERLEIVQNNFDEKEERFFHEFVTSVGVASIKEFRERIENSSPEVVNRKIEQLQANIVGYREEIARNQAMLDQMPSTTSAALELEAETLTQINLQTTEKEMKIDDEKDLLFAKEKEISELSLEIHENKEIDRKLMNEIFDSHEKIYENLSKIQEVLIEDYETLNRHFMEQMQMPLKTGSLKEFMMPRRDLPMEYKLVEEQLKLIEVNFGDLKKSLKENVDNIVLKSQELLENVLRLEDLIDKEAAIIPNSNGEVGLRQVDYNLNVLKNRIDQQTDNRNGVRAKHAAAVEVRNLKFVENVRVINETVKEFYLRMYRGHATANFAVRFPENPVRSTIFTYQAIPGEPLLISSETRDYVAALAFVFGVLKAKGQKFVVLYNATCQVTDEVQSFFRSQNDIQIISFTRLFCLDYSNYSIIPRAEGFLVITPTD